MSSSSVTSPRATGKVSRACLSNARPALSHRRRIGYQAPQNLQNYAKYLDTRIRAYRELKHDAIRVQSETNRDMRNSQAIDEEMDQSTRKRGKNAPPPPSSSNLSRSKTMAGRKLRVMTVEKGLLRETKIVQRMVDSLVDCRVRRASSIHAFTPPTIAFRVASPSSTLTTWRMNSTLRLCGCW